MELPLGTIPFRTKNIPQNQGVKFPGSFRAKRAPQAAAKHPARKGAVEPRLGRPLSGPR